MSPLLGNKGDLSHALVDRSRLIPVLWTVVERY